MVMIIGYVCSMLRVLHQHEVMPMVQLLEAYDSLLPISGQGTMFILPT